MADQRTCFKRIEYQLTDLLHYIDLGDIGLPDIQRPFVWSNAKVRDLFDSMYRGFPVGYLLFWANDAVLNTKQIGLGDKQHQVPNRLIVDGQQRLTSLYAVFRGHKVLDDEYRERRIEIAFRPRDGRFEVGDAATRQDPEFVPDISQIWCSEKSSRKLVNEFIATLAARTPLSDAEEETIAHNLDRLFDLQKYPFTALEIAPTVDEEQVADIFVRINSEGVKLNQADFILTLLSVFWEEGRVALETFSRRSRLVPAPGEPRPRSTGSSARSPTSSCGWASRSGSAEAGSRASTRCCAARTWKPGSSRRRDATNNSGSSAARRRRYSTSRTGTSSSSACLPPATAATSSSGRRRHSSTATRSS